MTSEKKQFQFDRGIDMFLDGQYIGIVEADVSYDFGFVSGDGKWETGSGKGDPKFRPRIDITLSPRSVPVEDSRKAARAAWERIQNIFQVGVDPAKADETSKTVSKDDERLEPGIGYRFLDKDELVVEGDEYWYIVTERWVPTGSHHSSNRPQGLGLTYRRRNQFAEGELVQIIKPATQALRDGYPGWVKSGNMDHLDGKVIEAPKFHLCSGRLISHMDRKDGGWKIDVNWLAPASSKQKEAFLAEKAAEAAAEKQPPKDPGIGYRFLDKEELVVEGDEFWSPSAKKWFAAPQWSPKWSPKAASQAQWENTPYRRRNQFAEGELVQIIKPATQAFGELKWRDAMDYLDGKVLLKSSVVPFGGRLAVVVVREGDRCGYFQPIHGDWLAPASSRQKAAFQAEKAKKAAFQAEKDKKAKVQELEDKMKAIESELAILKGT